MASSDSPGDKKWSGKNELTSESPSRDKSRSPSDNKSSALKFTPTQVHKRVKDSHNSVLKRKSYDSLIEEDLGTSTHRDKHGKSPRKDNSRNSDRSRSSESFRKSSLSKVESCKSSTERSDQDLDRRLENYRCRDECSQSNGKHSVSSSKSSSSGLGSRSSAKKSDCNLDSDFDEDHNLSVYVTPEGTPISRKSKDSEEKQHSRFKRSFSDEYNDESRSANSSFNTSDYFTPESSPRKSNPAKRQKTRWSDSSSFSCDNSPYLSWRDRSRDSSEKGIQPELIGYQMVGDSQFCRFGQQLLGLERVPMPNSPGRIGICVSGQTITDLHKRVRDNFYPISDKIILMIGTNDFLRNVNVTTMCEELSSLIVTLQKSASDIILLTLPPIPKLEKKNSSTHFHMLDTYNKHIRSLGNGETLRIADISPLYVTPPPYQRCKMHLFEVFFNGPARRLDLIHLNRCGLEIIRKYILDKFIQ